MREEGDGLLEVIGAGVVDVEVAAPGVAAVADEAGESGCTYVTSVSGRAVVMRPQKQMLWMGEVSSMLRRHRCVCMCIFSVFVINLADMPGGPIYESSP